MTEGVDYDFPPNPNGAQLVAAGKHFAGRYVGPGTSDKQLTAAERDDLFAHGVDIFLLAEGAATGARGGRAVGRLHAQEALAHARSLGAPDSAAIYFAVDYDLATSDWPTARDYLTGAGDVLGVGRVGVYGEHDVMVWAQRDGVASWFFQTYAWSHGQWFPGNHIEQYLNGQTLPGGGGVDLCRAKQASFGQWAARPTQGQQEDGMRLVQAPSGPGLRDSIWLIDGVGPDGKPYLYAPSMPLVDELKTCGVPYAVLATPLDQSLFHRMPDGATPPDAVPVTLTDEQLAEVTAAAKAGAPTHDELVEAAFEGAQQAEKE